MSAFFLSLLGAYLPGLWSRSTQGTVQFLRDLGDPTARLVISLAIAAITAAIAAAAGSVIGATLSNNARGMFVAICLIIAAVELAWPGRESPTREPTHSWGAFFLVTLFRQQTDAARLLVAACAAYFAYPVLAALGGAIGGAASLVLAWSWRKRFDASARWRPLRWGLAAAFAITGIVIGLSVRQIT